MCAPLFVTRFSHFSQNRVDCCSVRPIIRDPTNSVTDLIADINDGSAPDLLSDVLRIKGLAPNVIGIAHHARFGGAPGGSQSEPDPGHQGPHNGSRLICFGVS